MWSQVRLALVVPLTLAVAVVGCSGAKKLPAKLSGTVKYKGQPVTGGSMQLISKDQGSYSATIKGDGSYSVGQLPAGEMTVTVETESVNKDKKIPEYGGGGKKGMTSPPPPGVKMGGADMVYVKIPAKYADQAKTDIKITLTTGNNTKDIELKD